MLPGVERLIVAGIAAAAVAMPVAALLNPDMFRSRDFVKQVDRVAPAAEPALTRQARARGYLDEAHRLLTADEIAHACTLIDRARQFETGMAETPWQQHCAAR